MGLYRSLLADRQVLVLLDNASDAGQVRPLLPGAHGCMAVVTSRNQLAGLVTTAGAFPVTLDLPTVDEACQLLEHRLGAARVAAESPAVDEIITLCARLPLALAIVATRAATQPGLPLATLAAELREAKGGLAEFTDPDLASDVRAVFSWSYKQLSQGAARVFRLLGLHPGPDISLPAAASLFGQPAAEVRPLLAELVRAHLLARAVDRYALHDLLRAYAAELLRPPTPMAAGRRAAPGARPLRAQRLPGRPTAEPAPRRSGDAAAGPCRSQPGARRRPAAGAGLVRRRAPRAASGDRPRRRRRACLAAGLDLEPVLRLPGALARLHRGRPSHCAPPGAWPTRSRKLSRTAS